MATKEYAQVRVGVDLVILTIQNSKLKVFLNRREKDPFLEKEELPGGLLTADERAEETLQRKLHELTGHKNIYFRQFYTFTNPKRDPRTRTISIGFVALLSEEKCKELSQWFECDSLSGLAFDHKEIVLQAREHIKENFTPALARQLMPQTFPLNTLQKVYEIIEGKEYDNRNFRKKMIASGVVKETGKRESGVSHRPAKLFCFS